MVTIEQMLKEAIARDASDIFLVAGHPYAFKINGEIHSMQETRLMPNDTAQLIQEIYQYALQNTYEDFLKKKDDDFSFSIPDVGRFRCNVYLQRNSQAAVLRVVRFELPDPVEYTTGHHISCGGEKGNDSGKRTGWVRKINDARLHH